MPTKTPLLALAGAVPKDSVVRFLKPSMDPDAEEYVVGPVESIRTVGWGSVRLVVRGQVYTLPADYAVEVLP